MNMCFACGADTLKTLCDDCDRRAKHNILKSLGNLESENAEGQLIAYDAAEIQELEEQQ